MKPEMKSERRAAQEKIVKFLEANKDKFNAPYGILEGMEPFGKGKVRTITFGVSAYLDAVIRIYKPNKISIDGQGKLLYKYAGSYSSVEQILQVLKEGKKE